MQVAKEQLRSIVDRIEAIESQVRDLNDDKSGIYKEAKGQGYDVKALKAAIAVRRKDPGRVEEHEAIVSTYLAALGPAFATRACREAA